MKIAIDLRSLSSGSISGVENYIVNLLDSLLPLDHSNKYALFYNSWKARDFSNLQFVNSELKQTRMPNKLLNALLKLNLTKIENFTGGIDILFLPNLNQYSILPQTKLAITVHDMSPVVTPEFYDLKRRVWHTFLNYKKAFERANIIFAVSEYTKSDIVRLFNISENKIKVVYPGVNPLVSSLDVDRGPLRSYRNKVGLPGNFLLFLNTIEPRKNLSNLIRAFEQLELDTHLVIAGKAGWKCAGIFDQIRKSKKSDKMKYLGYLSEADKPKLLRLAQAVVYPSFYEGFGFVPIEAMSAGIPVVASAVSSIPEVIQNSALLVNPYNISEISFALHEVLVNENLRLDLIEKGITRAKEFTWKKTAQQILEGLNSLKN